MPSSEQDYGDAGLAAQIIELRQGSGLSMAAFAAKLGVSQPTQSRIERAKRLPDALYLRTLREHFHVDINALLAGAAVTAVTPDEAILLNNYRNSAPAAQGARAVRVQTIHGPVTGQVAGGNIINPPQAKKGRKA